MAVDSTVSVILAHEEKTPGFAGLVALERLVGQHGSIGQSGRNEAFFGYSLRRHPVDQGIHIAVRFLVVTGEEAKLSLNKPVTAVDTIQKHVCKPSHFVAAHR